MSHSVPLANRMQYERQLFAILLLVMVGALIGSSVIAQSPAEKPAAAGLPGKYEGLIKGAQGNETKLTLEIAEEKGKLSGELVTPDGATPISEGTFSDGKLALKLGSGNTASSIAARLDGDKLTGEWIQGETKRPVELKKVIPAAPASAPAATPEATTAVSPAGEWDGIADAQGQGFPFSLMLKLEGEKVTGESSSSLGTGTISSGSWKDGKLFFQIDTPSGAVIMNAVMKDGGLVGDFDFAGQAQGRWVAKKRTP